jgi:hypothetical protein
MPATKQHARGVSASTRVTAYSWQKLTDRKGVNEMWIRFGTAYIDGNSYKNSVIARYAADPGEAYGTAHIEYNLDHKCIKLTSPTASGYGVFGSVRILCTR